MTIPFQLNHLGMFQVLIINIFKMILCKERIMKNRKYLLMIRSFINPVFLFVNNFSNLLLFVGLFLLSFLIFTALIKLYSSHWNLEAILLMMSCLFLLSHLISPVNNLVKAGLLGLRYVFSFLSGNVFVPLLPLVCFCINCVSKFLF